MNILTYRPSARPLTSFVYKHKKRLRNFLQDKYKRRFPAILCASYFRVWLVIKISAVEFCQSIYQSIYDRTMFITKFFTKLLNSNTLHCEKQKTPGCSVVIPDHRGEVEFFTN